MSNDVAHRLVTRL